MKQVRYLLAMAFVFNSFLYAEESGQKLCSDSMKKRECYLAQEAEKIKSFSTRVQRSGDGRTRWVLLKAGKKISIRDKGNDLSDQLAYHYFENYFEDVQLYLFWFQGYECSGYSLINAITGKETVIDAKPIFSPDRRRFVTASFDPEAHYNPNGVEIWRIESKKLVKEGAFDWPTEEESENSSGPDNPKWLNNNTISVEVTKWVSQPDPSQGGKTTSVTESFGEVKYILKKGKWKKVE